MTDPRQSFDALAEALLREPDTSAGTGFGSSPGIRVGGRIAVMLVGGRFVAKLPAERCRALVDAGAAEPLSMGRRTMREWVTVGVERAEEWPRLAREALAFVRR